MTDRDRVFISYRRSDAAGSVTALRITLVENFGVAHVFQDVEGIDPGEEFPEILKQELRRAAVVLAVIGEGWLSAVNEFHQRRIDFPDDWVRIELRSAISEPGITVVPVLVDGAEMPPSKALPHDLRGLAHRHAVAIRHEAWDATTRPLVDLLSRVLTSSQDTPLEPAVDEGTGEPWHLVMEALDAIGGPAGQVVLITLDRLAQLAPIQRSTALNPNEHETVGRLLGRLVSRPVALVSNYAQEIFGHTFHLTTTNGRWLGYAIEKEARPNLLRPHEVHCQGCLLVLPDDSGDVSGAVLIGQVNIDYYGASAHGGPIIDVSPGIVGIGIPFGDIKTGSSRGTSA